MICGYRTGLVHDPARPNWAGNGDRPIAWSAWYPTPARLTESAAPPGYFDLGDIVVNAPLAEADAHPVVLLSHGTGGTAESLGWAARALAADGVVVLGANHHGNTGAEPYRPEGFLCWWERAPDLSVLLTTLQASGVFAGKLDTTQVCAVGFSLGGYTVFSLAGARTSLDAFMAWNRARDRPMGGPVEFPDAADHIPHLLDTSEPFRRSWARHGNDFTDRRITRIVSIAPAPTVRGFIPGSVQGIGLPVAILSGGADTEAPTPDCGDWLAGLNRAFRHHNLGAHVGHYTFLDLPGDRSLIGRDAIFTDHPTVDRAQVHRRAIAHVRDAIAPGP